MWTVPLLHRQRREVPAVRDGHAGEAEALASAFVVTLDVRLSKQRRQRTYQTRAVLFCPPPPLPPSLMHSPAGRPRGRGRGRGRGRRDSDEDEGHIDEDDDWVLEDEVRGRYFVMFSAFLLSHADPGSVSVVSVAQCAGGREAAD